MQYIITLCTIFKYDAILVSYLLSIEIYMLEYWMLRMFLRMMQPSNILEFGLPGNLTHFHIKDSLKLRCAIWIFVVVWVGHIFRELCGGALTKIG